jgi:hypothetical protein
MRQRALSPVATGWLGEIDALRTGADGEAQPSWTARVKPHDRSRSGLPPLLPVTCARRS